MLKTIRLFEDKRASQIHVSELKIKKRLLMRILAITIVGGCLGTVYRVLMGDIDQSIINGVALFAVIVSLITLYTIKNSYHIIVRVFLLMMAIVVYSIQLHSEISLVSFPLMLVFMLASMMFINGCERYLWLLLYSLPVFVAVFMPSYKGHEKELIDIALLSMIMLLIFNADEKIITNSKSYQIKLADEKRNALLGKMVAMIAHQWRQPLAAITAITSKLTLKAKLHADESFPIEEYEKIERITMELSDTIEIFRDVFRVENHKELFDLERLVDEALQSFKNQNSDVKIDINKNIKVCVRHNDFIKIIHFIVENAFERFAMIQERGVLDIKASVDRDNVILSLMNNGGAATEEELTQMFDPYFSTKSENQGVGLGLFIAKALMIKNGGTIQAHNNSEGMTFSVILPLKRK